jgi:transposase InsO family protein
MGIVQQKHSIPGLMVASTLHDVKDRSLIVRLMNPTPAAIEIAAGRIIGFYMPAELDEETDDERVMAQLNRMEKSTECEWPAHLKEAAGSWCKELKEEEEGAVKDLLYRYQDVFSSGDFDIGCTGVVKHSIRLKPDVKPVRQRPYRHAPVQEEEIERQVNLLKENGLIEEGRGAWSSPVVLVKKKDGRWRFCIDYRRINALSESDAYPLPRIDDSLDALGGNHYFSTLDMTSGYWQVELEEETKEKSAFVTRSGLWQWRVLPFGLTTAPSTFERLMETVMRGLQWKTLLVYLDDLIVFSKDLKTHLERLEEVFKRLRRANLKLKPSKCKLFTQEVDYLGHVVGKEGIKTDPKKVDAVKNWPRPQHKKDVRAFLGLTSYYRKFIQSYAEKSKPLTQLTTKHAPFYWQEDHQRSFELLKDSLIQAPVLKYPDFTKSFILDTDASDLAVGAVLGQRQDEGEVVVAYYSKMLSSEQNRYCATRKELLAVVKAVKHFRHYLLGRTFVIRTDHASLTWLMRQTNLTGQVARWVETLSEYSFQLEHRGGLKHMNADALSRQQCSDCVQCRRAFKVTIPVAELSCESTVELRSVNKLSELAKQQQEDINISPIYKAKRRSNEVNQELFKESSWETKQLAKMADHLFFRDDGVLVARLPIKNRRRDLQLCPQVLRAEIVKAKHELAHLGMQKTLSRIQLDWWWPGMVAEVRRYVKSCDTCQQSKTVKSNSAGERQHLFVGRPFQKLAVDLVGPFEETERGNRWILVVTDHFTRWSDAIAIPDATASVVATVLDERIFCYLGVPETIHTDQGSQFESELFQECCRIWGAEKTRTAPYSPTANGICERGNKTLGSSLRALMIDQEHRQWDLLLPQIMRTIRATPHTTTGETPNYLTLGREVRLPEAISAMEVSTGDNLPIPEYARELQRRLEEAGERLRSQQHQIRMEDTEEPSLYLVGDQVWLKSFFKKRGQIAKLHQKYI